jgi:hypothetical protein
MKVFDIIILLIVSLSYILFDAIIEE